MGTTHLDAKTKCAHRRVGGPAVFAAAFLATCGAIALPVSAALPAAPIAAAAPQSNIPSRLDAKLDAKQETQWLHNLSSAQYRTRRQAKHKFLAAGALAVPFLRHALHHATKPQLRGVLARVLRQIALRTRLGPTLITLHLKNVSPKKVLDAISRQAHGQFTCWPPQMWAQQQNARKISFNVVRQPFWAVMQRFQKKTGIGPANWGDSPGLTVRQLGQTLTPPTCYHGAFMVQAAGIMRNSSVQPAANTARQQPAARNLAMQLAVYCEPKLAIMQGGYCVATKAVTDTGRSLLSPPTNQSYSWSGNVGVCEWNLQPSLADVKHAGKYIKKFRGYWRCVVATDVKTWTIPHILRHRTKPLEKKFGRSTLVIESVKGMGVNQWTVVLRFTGPAGGSHIFGGALANMPAMQQTVTNQQASFLQNSLMLLDAHGNALGGSGSKWQRAGATATITCSFVAGYSVNNGMPAAPAGARPTALTLRVPVQFREVRIPLRFRDLRLP